MNRLFCDKCHKEIYQSIDKFYTVEISSSPYSYGGGKKILRSELCEGCIKLLVKFNKKEIPEILPQAEPFFDPKDL